MTVEGIICRQKVLEKGNNTELFVFLWFRLHKMQQTRNLFAAQRTSLLSQWVTSKTMMWKGSCCDVIGKKGSRAVRWMGIDAGCPIVCAKFLGNFSMNLEPSATPKECRGSFMGEWIPYNSESLFRVPFDKESLQVRFISNARKNFLLIFFVDLKKNSSLFTHLHGREGIAKYHLPVISGGIAWDSPRRGIRFVPW